MSEINIAPGKLNVGAVISQAFATSQSKFLFFVFTGLTFSLAILAGTNGGILLALAVGAVAQIVTVRAATGPLGVDAGAEFVPAVQAALPKFLPVFLTSLLVQILISLGMFFLIVPGVFLAVMLMVSTIACILEDRSPVEALKRSRELTRGNRWQLLGLVLILFIPAMGVVLLFAIPTAIVSIVPGIGALVGRVVASAALGLLGVFVAIILTHTFLELRRLHEASAPAPLI
ncbi:hypothetical protein [Phenylobacterium sp.]|uniref:hypothetical protein n=1 Tax=Phenylobacterium sp. TaxID=1871053 RepID=UPI0025FA0D3C|nr:hypothetical protein [Phenylobacterium sp.]MCA6289876.1 hypothetical protein [Phenylobacterium sp.]MCA6311653.1 hypothetical protein [Phenylobacterium sp.]MCA6324839.1 hypothetical protein [Phenylobacterium sp.]MCA6338462.1 hypothetical protein [Phenylobacterium sp.]MCA6341021.1 hypothetical protein [Phenylobacterium sp.]